MKERIIESIKKIEKISNEILQTKENNGNIQLKCQKILSLIVLKILFQKIN